MAVNPNINEPISFPLVILESPYAGDVGRNIAYAKACMRDCLFRGEAPYASHLLYTQDGITDDEIPEERSLGMRAGMAWGAKAAKTVVYIDHGISKGMEWGIEHANRIGRPVEYRQLYSNQREPRSC